jgi:hypothetical protein
MVIENIVLPICPRDIQCVGDNFCGPSHVQVSFRTDELFETTFSTNGFV